MVIGNIFYNNRDNEHAIAFDLDASEENRSYTAENLIIKTAFLGDCKRILEANYSAKIEYCGIHGTFVEKESGTFFS